jgi:DNA ligase-1
VWGTRLLDANAADSDWSRPYPFFLAHPVEGEVAALGPVEDWWAEWKWDGIRAQLVRRQGGVFLWSRGEELLAGRFPEVEEAAAALPEGTVLDGELLAWRDDAPMPFAALQRRITRKTVGAALRREVPVRLVVYDCLEHAGADVRAQPLQQRRAWAEGVVRALPATAPIVLSPLVPVASWEGAQAVRDAARARQAEGLMLKRRASPYGTGRRGGDWWKWKVTPLTIDAVLVYAQAGHGRRAGLYTDYTFAVWDGDALVTVAKAYSGPVDPPAWARALRPGGHRGAAAGVRAGLRGRPAQPAAQERRGGALPAHRALAARQAGRRGRHAGGAARAGGGGGLT